MSDATTIVKQSNVVLREALRACAALRGQNVFLDHALDASDRVHLPEETKLVGYGAQEKAFLVFLKTLEPHLPRTPATGPRSRGELLLRTESGATWFVLFVYGRMPKITVQRLAWVPVPFGTARALRASKGPVVKAPKRPTAAPTRLVDPSGAFVIAEVSAKRLVVVRGHAGEKGRQSAKSYARPQLASLALQRLIGSLRAKGYR